MSKVQVKNFILIVLMMQIIFLSGCEQGRTEKNEKIKITVSIPTYKNISEKIGGNKVEAICLLRPGINPEEFDPAPDILKTASQSDLYIRVGKFFDFENIWLNKITALKKNLKIFDSSEGIIEKDHNHHVWNGTAEVKKIAGNICEKLSELDPRNADFYSANYKKYLAEIDSVDLYVRERLSTLKVKTILTYHPAWSYYAAGYGLNQISIEDHGKMPKTKDLTKLVNSARDLGIKAIYIQPQFDNNTAKIIAGEIGARLVEINPLPDDFLANLIDITNKIKKYNE